MPIDEPSYSNFDLEVEPSGDSGYRARVVGSPAGEAAGLFTVPFSDLELENFLLRVGRPRRGTRRLESPEMEAARRFGSGLFEALFTDEIRTSLSRSRDAAERKGEGLRIRLRFSGAPELASLPWEFLFDESQDQFLVLSAWTPIVRYMDVTRQVDPLKVDGPLRVLVMISSPTDYESLDVEEEWRLIQRSLAPLVSDGRVVVQRVEGAQLVDLQRCLRQQEWHIFHYVGHGGYDSAVDDGVLVLEDARGRARVAPGRDLGTILHDHRSLRLAVLNACEGARASDQDPFSGTAQSLVRQGIPAVVAMQFEITDDAAVAFANEFYASLTDGFPVDGAIGEARRAIFGLGNDIEWATPVIYLRGDGHLFDLGGSRVPVAVGAQVDHADLESELTGTIDPASGGFATGSTSEDATTTSRNGRRSVGVWALGALALITIGVVVALFLAMSRTDDDAAAEAATAPVTTSGLATTTATATTPAPVTTAAPATTPAPATTATPATTAAPVTTAASATTTATVQPPTPPGGLFRVAGEPYLLPDPLPGSGGDFGSGCAPGPGPLPDGIWFGFVDAVTSSTDHVVFDLACLGSDLQPRNESESERVVAIHDDAVAVVLDESLRYESAAWYADWWDSPPLYTSCGLYDLCVWGWLYVNGGLVTEVVAVP